MSARESEFVLTEISTQIRATAPLWVKDASILSSTPEIVTRPWSFMLRYSLDAGGAILVKVARHKKMTLAQSIDEQELLKRTEREFEMLSKIAHVFQSQNGVQEFCFVRPLDILPRWNALAMEELDAQPLKTYLLKPKMAFSAQEDWLIFEKLLAQSARWLHTYHQGMGNLQTLPLAKTGLDERIEKITKRLSAYLSAKNIEKITAHLLDQYENLANREVTLAMLHGDFHCGNILVTRDGRVGALDADLTHSPIYQDIAKFFADLRTRFVQMLTQGKFLRAKALARAYRAITSGYFDDEEFDDDILQLFIKVAILEKWLIDEDKLAQSSGVKFFVHKALSNWRHAYFSRLMQDQPL